MRRYSRSRLYVNYYTLSINLFIQDYSIIMKWYNVGLQLHVWFSKDSGIKRYPQSKTVFNSIYSPEKSILRMYSFSVQFEKSGSTQFCHSIISKVSRLCNQLPVKVFFSSHWFPGLYFYSKPYWPSRCIINNNLQFMVF